MNDARLIHVLTALYCEPWLITPQMHKTLTEIASNHVERGSLTEQAQHAKAAAMEPNPARREFAIADKTAIVPVEGVIGRKFSDMLYDSGVTSIDILDRMLKSILEDDQIDSVVMVFDSPGGMATGVPEASATISKLNETKPVVAYVDGLCCSAAYWMASQARVIYAMPSADVGSIGAYLAVLDRSRQAEMQGVEVKMFKSGKHKGMGYPGTSLSDEQTAMLQQRIDDLGNQFKTVVKSTRDKISDETMQGQSFAVAAALQNGLIDGIATFDDAMRDASTMAKSRANRR